MHGVRMTRYYFHIREGWTIISDDEGMEFATLQAAKAEAYASADDLVRAAIRDGLTANACTIEIWDQAGNVLDSVKVSPQQRLA